MASKALFIKTEQIVKFTALNGNIDVDKFVQFAYIAQDIHIQNYLGTDLYNKMNTDILAGNLTGVYLDLLNDYIKDMIIHWAMVEYLPWAAYSVSNKGVYKHGSENAETISKDELNYLVEKERDTAEHYTQRFIDYICYNSATFPEYNTNSDGDMNPSKDNFFSGWVI